ncbi:MULTISPECIES: sigma-54 dependent transcriptional regulator [unclassified Uliginosibacterium]|uniref:sigma-54-dependent transcriptional regulator n=1 Tax=unclassified Uliginosibacterium TaxID=2621521 RepID=UPI000C7B8D40|nr:MULTISPECIES: response regulator [unclassified Uliginosibacterium]MDO6386111.1 response regulator [Uliginosibacterium sp. 31-12]PLK49177.1 sigma-54-dependent Fis family transcriptional regulator [Uliginosibacterium sp. TH139]
MAKILVVDDEIGIRELLREILCDEGYDVILAENATAARSARQAARPDLVLLDIWMPDTDGVTLLKEWAASGLLSMPVIMMSGHGTIDTAVEAIRFGALDFLEKPIALQKLLATVKRGLQRQPSKAQTHLTLNAFTRSTPLRDLRRRLDQLCQKSRVLLLRVGAGSLAELCARSLQAAGSPWLDLGSFGQPIEIQNLEAARGGMLFIEDLSLLNRAQQKNLAFALDRLEKHDQRLLAACSRTADELLTEGWDPLLVRRLFEVSLVPPSLLELKDELPEMVTQLLQHLAETGDVPVRTLSTGALNALRNSPWGGGFPELKAAVRSLALGSLEDEINADEVVRFVSRASSAALALPLDLPLREARETFERIYFEHHLQLEDGNITRLAEKTGLERTHLYRKLKQLGIQVGRRSES